MVPIHICCLLQHGGWLLAPLDRVIGIELMCVQPITIQVTKLMSVAAGALLRQNDCRICIRFLTLLSVILKVNPRTDGGGEI
jgi:hypothetical protein